MPFDLRWLINTLLSMFTIAIVNLDGTPYWRALLLGLFIACGFHGGFNSMIDIFLRWRRELRDRP